MGYTVFDSMFNLLPTMAFVLLIFIIVRSIRQWNQDNHAPRLTVAASVVTKRSHTRYDEDQSFTTYYATFQFESGDRLEMRIPNHQIGYLVEGDRGQLTFQGTRFLSFERT